MASVSLKQGGSSWRGAWCGWRGGGAARGAGGAAASLAAAASLLLPLPASARVGVWRGLALFVLGLVHFTGLFSAAAALLLRRRGLAWSRAARLDVANKAVSAVQALWASAAGAAVCAHSCRRDAAAANLVLSDAYAWFGAAYFLYDLCSMYVVHVEMAREAAAGGGGGGGGAGGGGASQTVDYEALGAAERRRAPPLPTLRSYLAHEPLMIAHHCFIGGYGFLVIVWLRGSVGDCVFGFVFLMEASTVFVSLRGVLARAGRRGSRLYAANGAAMLASFALCRLAALPYAALLYARARHQRYLAAVWALPAGCKLSILLLMLPQYYWFYLMCRGALRLVRAGAPAGAGAGAPAGAGAAAGAGAGAAGDGAARRRRS